MSDSSQTGSDVSSAQDAALQPFDVLEVELSERTLVEASAGTGKTYAISTLVVRLLLERDLPLERILVVTFTEAATAELKQRIRKRLKEALDVCLRPEPNSDPVLARLVEAQGNTQACSRKLRKALSSFDDVAVFTIHGFCHRVLRDNAFETGASADAELLKDTRPLSNDINLDFWARRVATADVNFVERLLSKQLTPKSLAHFADVVARTHPLRVIPERKAEPAPPDDTGIHAALQVARQCFDGETLTELLTTAGLHRGRYSKERVEAACAATAAYLTRPRTSVAPPDSLGLFSTARIDAATTKGTRIVPQHPFFEAVDLLLEQQAQYDAQAEATLVHFKRELADYVRTEVVERKRALGVVSFDDLLLELNKALCAPTGKYLAATLQKRFPVALIDEFQDTDPIQYSIFDRIYADRRGCLFMIGDPKQAIYSFRGADVFAYVDAARSVPLQRRLTMATNYRSADHLVQAVNRVFLDATRPFYIEDISFPWVNARPEADTGFIVPQELGRAPLQFRYVRGKTEKDKAAPELRSLGPRLLPKLVAAEVTALLNSDVELGGRPLSPKDFAVLTRTNAEAFDCQRALLSAGVPAVVLGDRSVFQYDEAQELELLLSAVLQPSNGKVVRGALFTSMLGLNANQVAALEEDEAGWDAWAERFRAWNQRWLSQGFVQMIRRVMAECGVAERLLRLEDGERRMTNLLHLVELLHTESKTAHLGPSGLLHHLVEQRQQRSDIADAEQIRLESDADAVVLTTIHKSKGLEYPIVVCPSLHHGMVIHPADKGLVRFHDPQAERQLTLDLGTEQLDDHERVMEVEALAENTRLLYVALTRAKYRCIVFWGPFSQFYQSPLGYVLHGDDANGGAPPSLEDLKRHLKRQTNDQLLARLRKLDPTGDLIGVGEADPDTAVVRYQREPPKPTQMSCRKVDEQRRRESVWQRTASFSALTSGAVHGADPLEGRDHDIVVPPALIQEEGVEAVTLADFAGGTATGNLFHAILEHCDFQSPEQAQLIEEKLREHGTSPTHSALVEQALLECLHTEFAEKLSLSTIPRGQRLDEMEFTLPAAGPLVTPTALAEVFSSHEHEQLPQSYAQRVSQLGFVPLRGFLKGFIDLIFVHQSKWYVVDYKTNNLGPNYNNYAPTELRRAMQDSHYVLQYHLYCLALFRYLALRLPNFDPEAHFGGAYYLFLRGMHPQNGARYGCYFDRPSTALLKDLGALFQNPLQEPAASPAAGQSSQLEHSR